MTKGEVGDDAVARTDRADLVRARRSSAERGVALVEFAIVLPVLLLLVLGLISGGLALNEKQQMTHATREGARFGATISAEQGFSNPDSWAKNVQALIVERSAGSLTSAQVCVSLVQGSPGTVVTTDSKGAAWFTTNGTSPCIANQTYPIPGGDNGRRVQVRTSKPASIELGLFGSHSITLTSSATARAELG